MPSLISAIWQFRRALNDLARTRGGPPGGAQGQVMPVPVARRRKPIQPADVSRQMQHVMFAPQNLLEDVNYGQVVPNDYMVELNREHYERHYRPIERQLADQWRDRLLDFVSTANSRYGTKKYHLGGRVRVRLRPAPDLAPNEVRVHCHINPDVVAPQPAALAACLEQVPAGRRWMLHEGLMTIGRDPVCDVHLEAPLVQQRRLVSGQHAHLRCEQGRCRLLDGAPDGRPSVNGTYVNSRRVPPGGQDLNDGDLIILAALDPNQPRPDTPGVASLAFRANCTR